MNKYSNYIQSSQWQSKHPAWLKRSGYRCSMFPWIRCGKFGGKYHKYNVHHTNYKRIGSERFGLDVIVVCPFAHWIIHQILGGSARVRTQRSKYPNLPQRLAHGWCRLPVLFKLLLIGSIGFGVWRVAI
jgi:hypothetical protein